MNDNAVLTKSRAVRARGSISEQGDSASVVLLPPSAAGRPPAGSSPVAAPSSEKGLVLGKAQKKDAVGPRIPVGIQL